MKKIDRETVQRIIDTADIVEVVSDFVHLRRSGRVLSVCVLSIMNARRRSMCRNRRGYASVSAAAKVVVLSIS